ncbi:MAG TPA: cell division protein ZapA [Acidiferrobacteraceae bacterium]|nr:cell division protein ZapA [Acidiferrobacteraceae bacterium]
MGKKFSVACSEEERDELSAAAKYLDQKMNSIQRSGKVIGLDRCAIMAALNISHELLNLRDDTGLSEGFESKLKLLQEKVTTVLHEQKELKL